MTCFYSFCKLFTFFLEAIIISITLASFVKTKRLSIHQVIQNVPSTFSSNSVTSETHNLESAVSTLYYQYANSYWLLIIKKLPTANSYWLWTDITWLEYVLSTFSDPIVMNPCLGWELETGCLWTIFTCRGAWFNRQLRAQRHQWRLLSFDVNTKVTKVQLIQCLNQLTELVRTRLHLTLSENADWVCRCSSVRRVFKAVRVQLTYETWTG